MAEALVTIANRREMLGEGEIDLIAVTALQGVLADIQKFVTNLLSRSREDLEENFEHEMDAYLDPKLDALTLHLG